MDFSSLLAPLVGSPTLRILDLKNFANGSGVLRALVDGEWPGLESILLNEMAFDAPSLAEFASAFMQAFRLGSLNLGYCSLHNPESLSILIGRLTQINFSYCSLQSSGFERLGQSIPADLKVLRVMGNEIGPTALHALVEHWPSSLEYLELSQNPIEDTGVATLAPILKQSPPLTDISLGTGKISSMGFTAMVEVLRFNTKLRSVNISENAHIHVWHDNIWKGIQAMLSTNCTGSVIILSLPQDRINPFRAKVNPLLYNWRY